ncbi:plasmid stabilization protein [Salinarchaeum chitinilyticum]
MSDGYRLLVSEEVRTFLNNVDEKTERIVRENLEKLSNPYPGRGTGDKEKIKWRSEEVYRLHIGRTWTAFYDVNESEDAVKVLDVLPIDQAHDEYGDLD